jgi:hypothetical protein
MKNKFGTKVVALLILSSLNAIGQNIVQDGNFALDTSLNVPVFNGPLNPGSPWTVTSAGGTLNGMSVVPLPNNLLGPIDPLTDGSPDRGVGQAPYIVPGTTTQTLSQNVNGFVGGNAYEVSFDAYMAYSSATNAGNPMVSVSLGANTVDFDLTSLPTPSSPSDSSWVHFYEIYAIPSSGPLTLALNFTASSTPAKAILVDRVYVGPIVSDPLDLECPTDIVTYTCSNCTPVAFAATSRDIRCSPNLTNTVIHYELNGSPIDSGYCFPPGVSTVDVLATNACPNSNTCSFTVTVIQITNPPMIFSCPTNITICTNSTGCGYMPDDTSEVYAGAGMTVAQSIAPGTLVCSDTNVIFTVSDPCGDVLETNVPCTLIDCGSNCLQIQCWTNMVLNSCSNVPVYYNPTATDGCCSNWTITCTPPSGSVFSPGTTNLVTVVATDDYGNTNTCTFTVIVNSCSNDCMQVESPDNILIDSCTNVVVDYPQLMVTDTCCGTNWSVVYDPPSGTTFAPGTHSLVNWFVYDCSSTNFVAAGSFLVSVFCTNCCEGPITNYTVTVVEGSNYLADCLCQGTSNTLADVITNVPVGTEVYFWNPTAGHFGPVDTFLTTGWHIGTEPMVPGEGFLLVSFTNQYQLTIYGIEPGCGGGCSPLTCSNPTELVGD